MILFHSCLLFDSGKKLRRVILKIRDPTRVGLLVGRCLAWFGALLWFSQRVSAAGVRPIAAPATQNSQLPPLKIGGWGQVAVGENGFGTILVGFRCTAHFRTYVGGDGIRCSLGRTDLGFDPQPIGALLLRASSQERRR